jgi:hypothetical protein
MGTVGSIKGATKKNPYAGFGLKSTSDATVRN